MSKRLAREAAMCLLYQQEITEEVNVDEAIAEITDVLSEGKLTESNKQYIRRLVKLFLENSIEIDAKIAGYNKPGWSIGRISKIDLSILRIALMELMYFDDIPYKVTANEAVELAKKYSGEKSPSYINGVLKTAIEELNVSGD